MKTALLLALCLATTAVIALPAASACPDPDNPCDPPPMSLCPAPPKVTTDPVRWVYCKVTGG